jgi:Mn2+/Fe2+ NRAMP family transporter
MPPPPPNRSVAAVFRRLGPGLVTGAADDDPSGIATYSQAGAHLGLDMLWSMVVTYPFMVAIQTVSARIGRVTGRGLTANMRLLLPRWLVLAIVCLLVTANIINLAADLAAMGEALQLIAGGGEHGHALFFGLASLAVQVFMPYQRQARLLKWLTVTLLAYVAVAFTVHVPWGEVAARSIWPHVSLDPSYITMVVAVFGTTISPYLFFWQAAQEVEDMRARPGAAALLDASREDARPELARIRLDTLIGMGFSNLIAFFIILSAAVTLHAAGVRDLETSAQAAEALRPLAGELTFLLFSLGIIGTGLLAVPVLAGSAAYAVAEAMHWTQGLDRRLGEARGFYAIIAFSTLTGVLIDFTPLDPVKALFWSAVINGVIAVPIMAVMMVLASSPLMGRHAIGVVLKSVGWMAVAVMALAVAAMFATTF